MRILLAAVFSLAGPSVVAAQEAWENWTVEDTVYAGICSGDVDETCVLISCENGTPSLSMILIGSWGVTMGDREDLTLSIGGGDAETISGVKRVAPGFGPEFYAITGSITATQLAELRARSAFAVSQHYGGFAALPLTGSGAAIDSACS